ncbi:MAG: hypothetical protein R2857_11215 [Vampirovibrionales bacterium]
MGKSFGRELIINRLDRLERILYGAPQPGSVNERISRLTHQPQQYRPPVQPFRLSNRTQPASPR